MIYWNQLTEYFKKIHEQLNLNRSLIVADCIYIINEKYNNNIEND